MCPGCVQNPLTLLSDLGQLLDLSDLLLTFLGVEVLCPRRPLDLVHCKPRILWDPIVILRPVDSRRERGKTFPDRVISTLKSDTGRDHHRQLTLPVRRPPARADHTVVPYA